MNNYDQLTEKISALLLETLSEIVAMNELPLDGPLDAKCRIIGREGVLDSLAFVSYLVAVEQKVNEEFGTMISLSDEKAFAEIKNPFRSVEDLTNYIVGQFSNEKQ